MSLCLLLPFYLSIFGLPVPVFIISSLVSVVFKYSSPVSVLPHLIPSVLKACVSLSLTSSIVCLHPAQCISPWKLCH